MPAAFVDIPAAEETTFDDGDDRAESGPRAIWQEAKLADLTCRE